MISADSICESDESTCRACMQTGCDMKFLFSNDLDKMYSECTNIQVAKGDGLPTEICQECSIHIEAYYLFRESCIKVDHTLRTQKNSVKVECVDSEEVRFWPVDAPHNNSSCTNDDNNKVQGNEDLRESNIYPLLNVDTDPATSEVIINEYTKKTKIYKFWCVKCPSRFRTQERFQWHSRSQCGKKRVECDICNKTFSSINALDTHAKTHTGIKDFVCHCGIGFYRKCNYESHLRTHKGDEGKIFVCEMCGEAFRSIGGLKGHKAVHLDEMPHQCTDCPKTFRSKNLLQAHLHRHTNIRNHICAKCGHASKTQAELRIHTLNIHSENRPYTCDICKKSFKLVGHLNMHVQSHTDRHKCQICGKVFTTNSTLKKHQLIHTGERPHKCELCGRPFSQKSALKTHMRVHSL